MSPENVEIVRRGLEALNARDVEVIERLVAPDAEWRPVLTAGGELERPVYRGPAGMAQYLTDLDEIFEGTEVHIEVLDSIGPEHVLFGGRVTARGGKSGAPIDERIWAVWELRDGKVVRGTAYRAKAEALEAVGLSESAMSQENVNRTYVAHEAFNRRDLHTFLAVMHPQTEFTPYEVAVQGGEPYRGRDGMRKWWEESLEVLPDLKVELYEVRDVGDRVFVRGRLHGHGAASGAAIERPLWGVLEFQDEMQFRYWAFGSEAEALEAAGPSE
jgi:ketosteroid isomerase-like protein